MNILKNRNFKVYLFIALLGLVFVTFWQSLFLGFYRDDWSIWTSQYYFMKILLGGHNHPGTWIEDYLLFKVFGFNTYIWQGLGLLLRAMAAFCVFLLVDAVTKSKKIAIVSAFLFAPSIIAMETVTWLSVYIVPQAIILSCLAFYFWIKFSESKRLIFGVSSVLLLITSIIGDPGRSIFIIPLIIFWEVLQWWISDKKEPAHMLFLRLFLFVLISMILAKQVLNLLYPSSISLIDNLKFILNHISYINNLYLSVANVLIGWMKFSHGDNLNKLSLLLFLVTFVTGLHLTVIKKSRLGAALLLFTVWMPFVYIPNWTFNTNYVAPPTDRYLGMSAVGYVAVLAILFSYFPIKRAPAILTVYVCMITAFLLLNIYLAYQVMHSELSYRAASFTEPLWNQIYNDVPKGEKDSIFMYLGNDYAKFVILDWSGSIPYGIKANVYKEEELPIATSDPQLILKLLCEEGVSRPSMFGRITQAKRIKLSHIHAWELNNHILKNVSFEQRQYFQKEAEKNHCTIEP